MTEESLTQIAKEVALCQKCALHRSRKKSVPGEGPDDAEIMFIGEGPGFHENEQGRPFVGAAGNFLNELLGQAGMKREAVWIGNVVKCRPPGNRDPLPDELAVCDATWNARSRPSTRKSSSPWGATRWRSTCPVPTSAASTGRCGGSATGS